MFGGVFFYRDGEIIDPSVPTDAAPPRHMLITGVGRGGTTAAACMIEALGFEAEDATSYRESRHLRRYITDGDGSGAAAHIQEWSTGDRRMFWKDPKIWVPSFDPFLHLLPSDVGILTIVRDPLNIAARNAVLHAADLAQQVELASQATLKLVKRLPILTKGNAIVVSYEKLMQHTSQVVEAIAKYLGIASVQNIVGAVTSIAPTPDFYEDLFQTVSRKPSTASEAPPATGTSESSEVAALSALPAEPRKDGEVI